MARLLAPVCLLLLLAPTACKTDAAGPAESATEAVVKTEPGTAEQSLSFSPDEEQSLYLKMLAVEMDAGVKVPKDQLHTSRGLFECRPNGGSPSCDLRIRLPSDGLSAPQPSQAPLPAKLDAFARQTRPELALEARILTDVICDYIGKKSPPYNIEEVKCRAIYPRAPTEALFDGRVAEELAELVRGKTSFGKDTVTVAGSLVCRRIDASGREVCMARAANGGVMQDEVQEVSVKYSAEVMRRLVQATQDHSKLLAAATATSAAPAPSAGKTSELSEAQATLTCRVDSSKILTDGFRSYFCRASIGG